MRIVLDLQGAQSESRYRGLGRYTLSLAKAIAANRSDHEVLIGLNGIFAETIEPIRAAFDSFLPQENIRVWQVAGPLRHLDPSNALRRQVAEQMREAFLASLEPDLVHVSSHFEGFVDDAVTSIGLFAPCLTTAVSLHDLIPMKFPEPHPRFREYYAEKLQSFRRANIWLSVSKFSCREAISLLRLPADHVVDVPNAADPIFRPIEISTAERGRIMHAYGLCRPFICWVGTTEHRKNLTRLMKAFIHLRRELRSKFQLLIIGRMESADAAVVSETASALGIAKNEFALAGYVTDDELARIYNACHAFVFPSLYEGFGLPALEAMQCGAPVIAANTSSLPEVVGLHDAMFDPYSVEAIADKLQRVLTDEVFRTTLIRHGLQQARRYSWDASAKRALQAFADYHASRRAAGSAASVYEKLITSTADLFREAPARSQSRIETDVAAVAEAIAQNHPAPKAEPTFLIDVSELCQRDAKTGIQRVTRNLLRQLIKRPPLGFKAEAVYATDDGRAYRYARRFTQSLLGVECNAGDDSPIEFHRGDIFFGLDLQHHVVTNHRDLYRNMRNLGVKVYFLIYDLLPIQLPHCFPPKLIELHHRWLAIVSQSDGVICISRDVADQYLRWIFTSATVRQRPLKIGWFHLGTDGADALRTRGLLENSAKVLTALSCPPSFLMVGTMEPRKGYAQVLAAFELLWAKGYDLRLALVGKRGWMVDSLIKQLRHHRELERRLFWLENVSDEYLESIYAACSCLIAASEGEGYGLPLIEAARHKLPILARDIPVFREVAGDHASYFHATTPERLADAIVEWLTLRAHRRHPKSDDLPCLTWEQSAERLKQIVFEDDWYAIWPPDRQWRPADRADSRANSGTHELGLAAARSE